MQNDNSISFIFLRSDVDRQLRSQLRRVPQHLKSRDHPDYPAAILFKHSNKRTSKYNHYFGGTLQ
ncbi:hypothetical protein Plhal304r1_c047g0129291 [Plasmopara halstedii]